MAAVGVEAKVLRTLNARLDAFARAQVPPLPVAWQNIDYAPGSAGYLRPTLLPARPVQVTMGEAGENRLRGVYQVDVFWPEKGGEMRPMEVVSAICAHFKRGTDLTTEGILVRIDGPPGPERPLQEPGWFQIPVSVPYTADVENPS